MLSWHTHTHTYTVRTPENTMSVGDWIGFSLSVYVYFVSASVHSCMWASAYVLLKVFSCLLVTKTVLQNQMSASHYIKTTKKRREKKRKKERNLNYFKAFIISPLSQLEVKFMWQYFLKILLQLPFIHMATEEKWILIGWRVCIIFRFFHCSS